ncbi:MAG: hypothetical protein NTV94_02505, partial [Planctomycetota bacterium]|nr:hypothetical protein [Planctomycetota bacterium]
MISGDTAARFALITLQRQLSSCLFASIDHFSDQGGSSVLAEEVIDAIGGDEDEIREPEASDSDRPPGDFVGQKFADLIRKCKQDLPRSDSKLKALLTVLRDKEKVVVFSYFKRSLRYLEREVSAAGIGCVRIDGDVPSNAHDPENDERLLRIGRFRD